jgi:ribonuclease HI
MPAGLTGGPSLEDRVAMAEPDQADLHGTILRLETALATRDFASLPGGLDGVLDDDFVEIGSRGRLWTRAATIAGARGAPPAVATLADFEVDELVPGVVIARFVSLHPGGRRVLRSSIWVLRHGAWRVRFHQGTVAAAPDPD